MGDVVVVVVLGGAVVVVALEDEAAEVEVADARRPLPQPASTTAARHSRLTAGRPRRPGVFTGQI
ncbi:MAG: hypothetical protein WB592_17095 [Acidimicrobiales bacterium]